jgi:nucleoside-diphosphate-sugar epimerase/1-acyl-sn-glycerol-3-phosphate acyltransferase
MIPANRGARILLTGCTGFVGKVVLEELMRRREELDVECVYLLIRPRRRKSPEERFDHSVAPSKCFSRLDPGWRRHCSPVAGDMLHDGLGLSEEDTAKLQGDLTHIIHCAASVRFDLPIAEASEINISGALRVLEFAKGCATLQRLVDVSTAYVTPHPGNGTTAAVVMEKLVDLPFDAEKVYEQILAGEAEESAILQKTGHPNTYTFTKCLAERILVKRRGDVPLTLLRPSVVSACRNYPFPGWIDSHAAYAAFISLLGAGHLKAVRTDPNTLIDVVPCDDVAARILSCTFEPELQEPLVIRHAVAGLQNSGASSRLAKTHERHFKAAPHEREAGLLYVGPSKGVFRLNELMHHQIPLSAAKASKRFSGQKRAAVRIKKLAAALGYLDEAFNYFTHHTFDFRTQFPPLKGFDLDSYLEAVSYGVGEHLLKRNPVQAPLRMHGTDLRWALRQPEGNATTRAFAYVVRKALRAGGAEITFNETEIKAALKEVRPDDLVILAPSHRSYLDFLITSLLCFAHPGLGLKLPRVAATDDFARIPIIGRLLEGAGAFYIKRGVGAPDPELTQQIVQLVESGQSLSFYAEGTRSRSRRFLVPKRGILRALQQAGRPAVVVPLSISYDRIAEEEGFLRELEHGVKHRSGLAPLLQWTRKLMRRDVKFGRIHIRAGAPLRISSDTDIRAVSRGIVAELQSHTAVTSFHIRVFCEHNARLGVDPSALRSAILRRGGVIIESKLGDEDKVPPLLRRTYDGQWMHLFYHDARTRYPGNAAVMAHIRRNGFWFPEGDHADDALADAVVEALFEPVCRDYQRVAQEVERMPASGSITAHDIVARLDDAFLGDIEDALMDLAERGIVTRDRERFRWAEGPRDLSDLIADYAWSGVGRDVLSASHF